MSQATEPRLSSTAVRDELSAYVLGIGKYIYPEGQRGEEQSLRILHAIRAVIHLPQEDAEATTLRFGAQLSQVDRTLAAIFVHGALEAVAGGIHWSHISEATLFRVARDHGRLLDYVSFSDVFSMPRHLEYRDPLSRYFLFSEHYLSLSEGPARQGLRLGVVSLFDRSSEAVAAGLVLSDRLRGRDPLLDSLAGERLILVLERHEIDGFDSAHHDLDTQVVASIGRWGLVAALPHLYELLKRTTSRDRSSRVLRALILRAIEQLS